jgi:hypothetical protein
MGIHFIIAYIFRICKGFGEILGEWRKIILEQGVNRAICNGGGAKIQIHFIIRRRKKRGDLPISS